MAEKIWDKEIDVPQKVIEYVDENVLSKLPAGTQVKGIFPHGASYWTRTAEIETTQPDGSSLSFFLKVSQDEGGRGMMSGEYVSMKAIYDNVPDLVPTPIGWGTYTSDPNIHFFLCSFHDMTNEIPDARSLASKLAELHKKGISPNGKYGFPVPTFQGRIPQETNWTDTWEEFFSNSLKRMLAVEEAVQSVDTEMKKLSEALLEKVVPRLLRPLETGGRRIQPCLVHSDLWDGNTSTDIATGLPIIFDAPAIYAHNEYELAPWRPPRHKIGKRYVKAYQDFFEISPPAEDFDDRNALYCIRFNMCSSALYPGNLRFRKIVMEEIRSLVEKFPEGYEGWQGRRNKI